MKRFVQSEGYARTRLVLATLFIVLGSVTIVRAVMGVGLTWKLLPAFVLGAAMIALGAFRYRDYFAARARR